MSPDVNDQVLSSVHNQWVAGVIGFLVVVLIPFIKDFWKDRRERRNDEMRERREQEAENVKQGLLRSLADSNQRIVEQLGQMNYELAANRSITDDRHAQNLVAISRACRFNGCGNGALPAFDPSLPGYAVLRRRLPAQFSKSEHTTKK